MFTVLQRVTVTGTFTMTDGDGDTSSVTWEESYLEAWTFPFNRPPFTNDVTDNHLAGPTKPARYLEQQGGFNFKTPAGAGLLANACSIRSWDFQMTAKFEMAFIPMPVGWNYHATYSGNHKFTKTANVDYCDHRRVPKPKGRDPFPDMLYPGGGDKMPAFPAAGKVLTDTDTWEVHWNQNTGLRSSYTPTGYQ